VTIRELHKSATPAFTKATSRVAKGAARHWIWWVVPVVAIPALLAPMVLTKRGFGPDWTNHLWLVWSQGRHIKSTGLPTYFIHGDFTGVFYPFFAFYGGTLYTIAGTISALLNDSPTIAFVFTFALGFVMAYGGWLWLSFQAGLKGWQAHAPSLVFVTSAYYLTNAYARGAWPELMATSAIPLVIASMVSLIYASRWRPWPVVAFLASTVILTGSHNITLLWSAVFFPALALIAVWALPNRAEHLPWRRLVRLGGLALMAIGANMWFLLPDVIYSNDVTAGLSSTQLLFQQTDFFNEPEVIFHPLRFVPSQSTTPGLYIQVPVFALLWAMVVNALLIRSATQAMRRMAVGTFVLMVGFFVLVFWEQAWTPLPDILTKIQFAYRLSTYILLCLTALVLTGLVVARQTRRRVQIASWSSLAVVVCFGFGLAMYQVWSAPSYLPSRDLVYSSPYKQPKSWYDILFRDVSQPVKPVSPGRTLQVPPDRLSRDGGEFRASPPTGYSNLDTNVAGGPYLARIEGVERVGRDVNGYTVVRRNPGQKSGPVRLTMSVNHPAPVVIGIAITLVAVASLVVLALSYFVRVIGRHRRALGPG
jgi:hypothetical protein